MFPDLTRDDVFRIETRRLWLRWPTAKDIPAIVTLAGERDVAEMTAHIPHPLTRSDVDEFLIKVRGANSAGTGLTLALARRESPCSLIGLIGIAAADGTPHLGYWLGRPWWGNGLMSEAASGLVHAFFAYTGGDRLTVGALPENRASQRVIAKTGFGWTERRSTPCPARGGPRQLDWFALDRAGWAGHQTVTAPVPDLALAS
ncbi:Protein N-acetyltransferase, RimJ/RimL family [Methylobacterium phyllostachyos]|uniref:Protein N-acetyltransferase, RimJ/RimL family n=1 Tax=Methylobacterium phyllostachyos TaxID=582672 RepID=A0A1G9VNF0_9HYPH|nr:GNAT family N-acetyltransferase [Methylobacterium phyllostachyos]SDM73636.1 Protein N-acetyltransferase, RimJ/RimL family [Methylobacterium phyllostachyos]